MVEIVSAAEHSRRYRIVKKPTFERLKNNTLKVHISRVSKKDLDVLCYRYDLIHARYMIIPQAIEVFSGNNKRGIKKTITLYYAALHDNSIKELQKLNPKRTYYSVKELFSHIENIFSHTVRVKHEHKEDGDQHVESKDWSRHRLYREYMTVNK